MKVFLMMSITQKETFFYLVLLTISKFLLQILSNLHKKRDSLLYYKLQSWKGTNNWRFHNKTFIRDSRSFIKDKLARLNQIFYQVTLIWWVITLLMVNLTWLFQNKDQKKKQNWDFNTIIYRKLTLIIKLVTKNFNIVVKRNKSRSFWQSNKRKD